MIKVQNIYKSFDGNEVLKNISAHFGQGKSRSEQAQVGINEMRKQEKYYQPDHWKKWFGKNRFAEIDFGIV